jgi:glycosyltransferase involved in cell wall biosynthesis
MAEKLKLLTMAEATNTPTGYGIVIRNLILGLIKKGWDIWHIGFQRYGLRQTFGDGKGNTWIELQAGGQMGHPGYPNYLGSYLDDFKPDVVFSLVDIFYTDEAIRQTNARGIPYVSYWPVDNPNFRLEWLQKLKRMSYPLTLSKFGKKIVDDVVKTYGEGGWKYHFNIDYIYHGVDINTFQRFPKEMIEKNRKQIFNNKTKFPGGENTFVYYFCGKNCRRKQIDRLLCAFKIVADKYRDVVLFLKVGDPNNVHELGLDLPDLIQKFGLVNKIVILDKRSDFLDGMSDIELAGWYNISDVHVSATGGEGFGLTTIESMACGKPVIITDCSTSPELIGKNNERGWLVPVQATSYMDYNGLWSLVDIEKMAEAMEEAYLDRKLTKKKGNDAYRWVRKNLEWGKIVDQFDKYLRKVVAEYNGMSEKELHEVLYGDDDSDKKE